MADVQILRAQSGRKETLSSSAWHTACSIPAGSFTAGDKYLLIGRLDLMYSGTADEVQARFVHGTTPTQFTDAYEADEVLGNKVVGVGFMAVYTQPGTTEAVTLEYSSSTTAQEAILLRSQILAINLDDIGTQNTDYWWSEDTTDHGLTTTPTDGASVTFTPNGTDKYLYLAQVTWHPTDVSVMQTFHGLLVDGNVKQQVSEEGEDASNEYRNRILMWAETPTNASHTVKVQGWMESSNTSTTLSSRVLVLNLAKFSDVHIATGADDQITEYLQDTFTRSVSADGLGTSSSGHTYSVSDTWTGSYSVNGSNAVIGAGTGVLTAYASETVPNEFMVSGDFQIPTGIGTGDIVWLELGQWTGSQVIGAGVRLTWTGSTTALHAYIRSSVGRTYAGTSITGVTAGDWYSFKGIIRNGSFRARVWATAGNEPFTWDVEAVPTNASSQSNVGWTVEGTGSFGDIGVDNLRVWNIWSNALTTSFTPAASGDYVVLANPIEDFGSNQDPDAQIRLQIDPDGNGLYDYPGTLAVRDTFTEASGTPLLTAHTSDSGHGYTERWQQQSAHWVVKSTIDQAGMTGGTDDYAYAVTNSNVSLGDGYIEFQIKQVGDGVGMHVRWKGTSAADEDCYRILQGTLYRVTNGSATSLGSVGFGNRWFRLYASDTSPTQLIVQSGFLHDALDDTYASEGYTLFTTDSTAENQTASGEVGFYGLYDDFGSLGGNIDNFRVVEYGSLPDVPHGGAWDASDESPYLLMDVVPFVSGASRTINIDHRFEATLPENETVPSILDPSIVVFSKALAGGASTQNVTLTLVDQSGVVYAPTAIPDRLVTLTLIDPVSAVYAPTLIPDQLIELTLLDPVSAIYAPTVEHAAQDVTLTLLTTEVTGNGGLVPLLLAQPQIQPRIFPFTVAFGAQSAGLTLLDPVSAIYVPVLTAESDIVLTLLDPVSGIYSPSLTPVNTVEPTLLDPISAIYEPVLTTENDLALTLIDQTGVLYAPVLTPTNTVDLTLLDPASAIYTPVLTPINTVSLTLVDPVSAIYEPVLTTENTVTLTLLDPVSAVYEPTLIPDQLVTLDLIDQSGIVYGPSLAGVIVLTLVDQSGVVFTPTLIPDQLVSLTLVDPASGVYEPSLTPINSVSPPLLDPVSAVYEPTLSTVNSITLTLLDPVSAIYEPTLSTLNSITLTLVDPISAVYVPALTPINSVDLTLLDPVSAVYTPTIEPGPATVTLDLIDQSGVVYGPSLASGLLLTLIDPVSAVYAPTLIPDRVVDLPLIDPISAIYAPTVAHVQNVALPLLSTDETSNGGLVPLILASPVIAPRIFAPTVEHALISAQDIGPLTLLDPTSAVYQPTLSTENSITLTLLDPSSTVYEPTISGLNTVDLTLLDPVSAVYDPTISTVNTVSLTLLDPVSAVYEPTLAVGPVTVELTLLDPVSAIYEPGLVSRVDLPLIDPVSAVYAPTLTPDRLVNLTLIDSASATYAPTLTPTNDVVLTLVDPTSGIYALAVTPTNTLDLTLIDQSGVVYEPALTAESSIALPVIDQSGVVYEPTLAAGGTVALPLIDSTSAIYELTLIPDQLLELTLLDPGSLLYALELSQPSTQDVTLGLIDAFSAIFELAISEFVPSEIPGGPGAWPPLRLPREKHPILVDLRLAWRIRQSIETAFAITSRIGGLVDADMEAAWRVANFVDEEFLASWEIQDLDQVTKTNRQILAMEMDEDLSLLKR